MEILFLSQRFLFPMDTGGKIRTGNILKHLSKKHSITLISNVESPKDDQYISMMNELCTQFIPVPWREVRRLSLLFFGRLALQMFSVYPVNVSNDYSAALRNEVNKTCKRDRYDLAICDFVQSALMFRGIKETPNLLFQHNVESMIMKRHFKMARNPISRLFWWLQWKKMARFEKDICKQFDRIISVSIQDKKEFKALYGIDNVDVIPTGVDTDYFKPMPNAREKKNSLVFCGSMDWLPNEDAMKFFIREIFPLIKKSVPDTTLTIVGRNPSQKMEDMVRRWAAIKLTGWVKDVRPYIAEGSVVIVPIRIGGGTRLKIYESLAMGKAVVSTSIGAEGLPVSNGENIIIENNPIRIAEKISQLLASEVTRNEIGGNALSFVRTNYSWENVAASFEDICLQTTQINNCVLRP